MAECVVGASVHRWLNMPVARESRAERGTLVRRVAFETRRSRGSAPADRLTEPPPCRNPIVIDANGARIPALGLGTFRSEGEVCVRAVSEAIRVGYRHIDTARMYGNEREVGEGLRASGVARDELFVTTKVWFEDIADGELQRSAEASLKRLGLDAVDLLLIHWPNRAVPLESSIKGLCDAKRRGLARISASATIRWRCWTRPSRSRRSRWSPTSASITRRWTNRR